jgi:hypothetical protein
MRMSLYFLGVAPALMECGEKIGKWPAHDF